MKRKDFRPGTERRGVILILVLAMLLLFAGLGLTFALIARTESQSARIFKRKFSGTDNEHLPYFKDVLGQIIYDTGKQNSALRGHSLVRDMYGGLTADPRARNDRTGGITGNPSRILVDGRFGLNQQNPEAQAEEWLMWWRNAYNGAGIPAPWNNGTGDVFDDDFKVREAFRNPFGVPDSDQNLFRFSPVAYPFNFTAFDLFTDNQDRMYRTGHLLNRIAREPEMYFEVSGTNFDVSSDRRFYGYDEDYDYPDWNNMFLAMMRPDGTVIIPSYHRPQLIRDLELRGAFGGEVGGEIAGDAWADPEGWRIILRPRRREYAGGIALLLEKSPFNRAWARDRGGAGAIVTAANVERSINPYRNPGVIASDRSKAAFPMFNGWMDLVDSDQSGSIGDHPSELDVDANGDGLKDSIWIDFGASAVADGHGGFLKPLAGILIVSLDGRVNLNTAGNDSLKRFISDPAIQPGKLHSSNLGASPAEINPKHPLALSVDIAAGDDTALKYFWNNSNSFDYTQVDLDPNNPNYQPLPKPHPYYRLLYGTFDDPNTPGNDAIPGKYNGEISQNGDLTLPGIIAVPGRDTFGNVDGDDGADGRPYNSEQDLFDIYPSYMTMLEYPRMKLERHWFERQLLLDPQIRDFERYSNEGEYFNENKGGTKYVGKLWRPISGLNDADRWRTDKNERNYYYSYVVSSYFGQRDWLGTGRYRKPIGTQVLGTFERYEWSQNIEGGQGTFTDKASLNDSAEINPYRTGQQFDDRLFEEMWLASFLRFGDVDEVYQAKDSLNLFGPELKTNTNYLQKAYVQRRLRNMFTTRSFDLNHYSAPLLSVPILAQSDEDPERRYYPDEKVQDKYVYEFDTDRLSNYPADAISPLDGDAGTFDGAVYRNDNGAPTIIEYSNGQLHPKHIPLVAEGEQLGNFVVNPMQRVDDFEVFYPGAGDKKILGPDYLSSESSSPNWQLAYEKDNPEAKEAYLNLFPRSIREGRRFNLNRPMRPYRDLVENWTLKPEEVSTNVAAEIDRQIMAAQIYMILRMATHTFDVDPGTNKPDRRIPYLAQLAVNIVDFMDPDDVITRFHFDPELNDPEWTPQSVVYGFEMPRLVINEAVAFSYRNFDRNPSDSDPQGKNTTWVFAELSNPWPSDPLAVLDADEAQIGFTTNEDDPSTVGNVNSHSLAKVWRLEVWINDRLRGRTDFTDATEAEDSGEDDTDSADKDVWRLDPVLLNETDTIETQRGRAIYGKNVNNPDLDARSYFVVGPNKPDPDEDGFAPVYPEGNPEAGSGDDDSDESTFYFLKDFSPGKDVDFMSDDFGLILDEPQPSEITIRLRRLRNPYDQRSPNPDLNPYVTIDEFLVKDDAIHDVTPDPSATNFDPKRKAVLQGGDGANDPKPPTKPEERKTFERILPWSNEGAQNGNDELGHTLAARDEQEHENSVIDEFKIRESYVHFLNRPLATPLELLYVRMFGAPENSNIPTVRRRPKMNFTESTDNPIHGLYGFNNVQDIIDPHTVPWFQGNAVAGTGKYLGKHLYRFFEFVETPSRFRGSGFDWRPLPFGSGGEKDPPYFRYPDYRADRVAGKVDLNNITAEEVLRAIIDDDAANPEGMNFDDNDDGVVPHLWKGNQPTADRSNIFVQQYPYLSKWDKDKQEWQENDKFSRIFAGRRPDRLVSSEMFRLYLLSLAGRDQILGTADDKPFRSYAAPSIGDTILRPGPPKTGNDFNWNSIYATKGDANTSEWSRLFASYSDTDVEDDSFTDIPRDKDPYDSNRLLAKIGGNVTTRSHVFGVWVTLGYFEVIPGTEKFQVPLLDKEVGVMTGTDERPRMFFIVDRSLATGYKGPKQIGDFDTDPLILLNQNIE